jgi:c-di-AMP phosphodiesterase-like protein
MKKLIEKVVNILISNRDVIIVFSIFMLVIFGMARILQIPGTGILTIVVLVFSIYFFIDRYFSKVHDEKYIESHLIIGKNMLLESNELALIIIRDNKILWANEYAYEEFPVLLQNRQIEAINLSKIDINNVFKYNNSIYKCSIKNDVYTIRNITQTERRSNYLAEYKPNIGIFQIDNYNYLADNLEETVFLNMISNLKTSFTKWFNDNNIHFQTISNDKMQLLIPTSKLEYLMASKFTDFNQIIKEYQNDDLPVTYSLGVATNQTSFAEAGKKAADSLELAVTRGGAQAVVVDEDKRIFFGGGNSVIKVNSRIKARVISNTLLNILRRRDVVYLMTHRNPDSDAIASILFMKDFIERNIASINVKVLIDENITKNMKNELELIIGDKYLTNAVIDKTVKNVLIIVDTQSNDIISHPKIVSEIEDKIIFDHHQTPLNYIERTVFNWIDPSASSATQLMLEMFNAKDLEIKSKDLANLGLLAIFTDSNNLKYSTSQSTLDAMSILVAAGGSIEIAREKQYLSFDKFTRLNQLMLDIKRINNVTLIEVENEDDQILLSMAVNEALEIRNIVASIIFGSREDGMYFVKMRSTRKINCKLFLEEFGGGGHARQGAGIVTQVQKNEIIKKIYELEKGE